MTDPQPGDFGLVKMAGDVGRLIRLGQWLNGDGFTAYEHAFILVDGGQIVEAEPGGARLVPLSYPSVLWSSGRLHFPDGSELGQEQRKRIVQAARHYIGTPYSAADYFALAAHRLHVPVPPLWRYVSSTGHMICSQLVDRCYMNSGVRLFNDGRWPGYVTPGALAGLLGAR